MMNKVIKLSLMLIFFCYIMESYARLEKHHKNSFYHQDEELNINRHVTLSWHSYPDNIMKYSDLAVASGSQSLHYDKIIDIDIKEVMVIKLKKSGNHPYNGMIAYLIKTNCGRWFIKYNVPVLATLYDTSGTKDIVSESATTGEKMFTKKGVSMINAAHDSRPEFYPPEPVQASVQTFGSTIPIKQQTFLFPATVELQSDSYMWNPLRRILKFSDMNVSYQILEEIIFK